MKKYFDGKKLKQLRKSKGLTAQQVADLINVSQSYISRFENNKAIPDVDMLQRILEVLDSDISSFYSENNLPPDLLQLLETAKKLTPEERKKVTEMIQTFLENRVISHPFIHASTIKGELRQEMQKQLKNNKKDSKES